MKTLHAVRETLRDLNPDHDPTIGNRRLSNWELQALREQACEFAEVRNAVSRYDNAGVRYTVALSLAASNYAALTRDSRPDPRQESASPVPDARAPSRRRVIFAACVFCLSAVVGGISGFAFYSFYPAVKGLEGFRIGFGALTCFVASAMSMLFLFAVGEACCKRREFTTDGTQGVSR